MKLRFIKTIIVTAITLVFSLSAVAETPAEIALNKKIIQDKLLKVNPNYKITAFKPAGLDGFYKVQLENGPRLYVSKTGDFLFDGQLYSVETGSLVNLTEKEQAVDRMALMKELNPKEMIVFSPKKPVKTKAIISVYTDVDCGYCQKLHQEVPELNAHGVEVRYLAFPRAGYQSPTSQRMDAIWCHAKPTEAMTLVKNNQPVPPASCANPIKAQYELGQELGVRGTPAVFLEDGTQVGGYLSPTDLATAMKIK